MGLDIDLAFRNLVEAHQALLQAARETTGASLVAITSEKLYFDALAHEAVRALGRDYEIRWRLEFGAARY